MKFSLIATFAALTLSTAVHADGIEDGKERVTTSAKPVIRSNRIRVKTSSTGGKVGPNLYGVVGRAVASVADFKYGDGIKAVGATGMVWDAAELETYMTDPGAWVKAKTGDDAARSLMTHKQKKKQEDIVAFLESVAAK